MSFLSYESVVEDALKGLPEDPNEALAEVDDRIRSRLSKLRSSLRARLFGNQVEFNRLYRRHIEIIYQFVTEANLGFEIPSPKVDPRTRSFPAYYRNFLDRMDRIKVSIRLREIKTRGGPPRLSLTNEEAAKILTLLTEIRPLIRVSGMEAKYSREFVNHLHSFGETIESNEVDVEDFFDLWMEYSARAAEGTDTNRRANEKFQAIARTLYKAKEREEKQDEKSAAATPPQLEAPRIQRPRRGGQ